MTKRRGEYQCDYKENSAVTRKHTMMEQKHFKGGKPHLREQTHTKYNKITSNSENFKRDTGPPLVAA